MKEENEITEEVRDLLDSLEQHGCNSRRQKELSGLIDSLAAGTSLRGASATKQSNQTQTEIIQVGLLSYLPPVGEPFGVRSARNDAKRRKSYPLWWIVGAAAACLMLWLLVKPAIQETPNKNEEILVEETGAKDTKTTQEEDDFIEEPIILEEPVPEVFLAEETPTKTTKPQTKTHKPTPKAVEEISEEPVLAENTPVESEMTESAELTDTSIIVSISTPIVENQLSAFSSQLSTPQRRVIRSLNLVCYECQKEPENDSKFLILNSQLEKTIFGQPQDPNMKNGSLAFELKLQ